MNDKNDGPRFPWLVPQYIFEKLVSRSKQEQGARRQIDKDYALALGICLWGIVLFLMAKM